MIVYISELVSSVTLLLFDFHNNPVKEMCVLAYPFFRETMSLGYNQQQKGGTTMLLLI